jgi:hypothetical protein
MRGFELREKFLGVTPLPLLGFEQALANTFTRIGCSGDIEEALIGFGILDDGCGLALNGEHYGPLALLELFHEVAGTSPERGQGLDIFRDVEPGKLSSKIAPF